MVGDAFWEDQGGFRIEILEVGGDAFVEGGVGEVDGGDEVDGLLMESVGAGLEVDAGAVDVDEACGGFVHHPDAAVGEGGDVGSGEDGEMG